MKKIISLIVFAVASLSAIESQKVMGPASYTDKTFDTLTIMGTLTGTGLTAATIDVYGPTYLYKGSEIGTATIRGPLTASDTSFTGPTEVYGNIRATDSDFKDDLTIDGDNSTLVTLENTTAGPIHITTPVSGVQQTSSGISFSYVFSTKKEMPKGPRVVLKGNKASISGPIEFIGQPGTVILADNATFTGKVLNGKVQKEALENKKATTQKEGVPS